MAERTGIMVLIRRHWKSILAAGIAAITVTALSVTTVTVATGGSIHIEGNGDLDITADSMIKSAGASDFLIESANNLSLSALGDGSVLAAANSAHMDLVADFARLYVTGGGDVSANLGGLDFSATSAGDDIELAADDVISFQTTAGGTNYINLNSSGINLWTAAATTDDIYLASGDDVILAATDAFTVSSADILFTPTDDFTVIATGDSTIATTLGGTVATDATGAIISAASAGDDVIVSANDAVTLAGTSLTCTADTTDWVMDASGFALDADGAGDDITLTGADLLTMATDVGGSLQTLTTGVAIAAISTGDDVAVTANDQVTISGTDVTITDGSDVKTWSNVVTAAITTVPFSMAIPALTANGTATYWFIDGVSGTLTYAKLHCSTASASAGGTILGRIINTGSSLELTNQVSMEADTVTWTITNGGVFTSTGAYLQIISNNADATMGNSCTLTTTYTRT